MVYYDPTVEAWRDTLDANFSVSMFRTQWDEQELFVEFDSQESFYEWFFGDFNT